MNPFMEGERRSRRWHWVAHCGSAVAIITLLVLVMHPLRDGLDIASRCWDMSNYYCEKLPSRSQGFRNSRESYTTAPANAALASRPYVTMRFNGSLWFDSPFKGPPTPASEEAWNSVMRYGMIAVSAEDYERTNHSLRTAVRFPEEAGGGYVATTVGTHQMHCLHYLWADHYRDHLPDTLKKIAEIPEMYERHYNHCMDYIRQSLMCHFDTGLVTYDWVGENQNPTPNSNAPHKCVDWDAAQAWLRSRVVEIPEGFEWHMPDGQESLPFNP